MDSRRTGARIHCGVEFETQFVERQIVAILVEPELRRRVVNPIGVLPNREGDIAAGLRIRARDGDGVERKSQCEYTNGAGLSAHTGLRCERTVPCVVCANRARGTSKGNYVVRRCRSGHVERMNIACGGAL